MSDNTAKKVSQALKGAILSAVEERNGAMIEHTETCPCFDCEKDRLENEIGEKTQESEAARAEVNNLREQIRSLSKELIATKDRAAKYQALWAKVPKEHRDVNMFQIKPKCEHCKKRFDYYVACRGSITGRLLAGNDSKTVTDRVINDGQLLARAGEESFPESLPEDLWRQDEKDDG